MKILLQDHDPDWIAHIRYFLDLEGYHIETAADSRDVSQKLKSGSFHVLILGLYLEPLDIAQFLSQKEIREKPKDMALLLTGPEVLDRNELKLIKSFPFKIHYFNKYHTPKKLLGMIKASLCETKETEQTG